jgi:hypothetical protein
MTQQQLVYLAISAAILGFFAVTAILASRRKTAYKRSGPLLLVNELRFLTAALQALPAGTLLTFKVNLGHIVTSQNQSNGHDTKNKLHGMTIDFVLIDRETSNVKLCIEILMEGRDKGGNLTIERALRQARIPHIKLPLVRFYDPVRLRQVFKDALETY